MSTTLLIRQQPMGEGKYIPGCVDRSPEIQEMPCKLVSNRGGRGEIYLPGCQSDSPKDPEGSLSICVRRRSRSWINWRAYKRQKAESL